MKIDLFDVDEFVDLNHLQPVSSPVLFQRGNVPHPEGLISNEIFGITTKSRKDTFAYIELYGHYFHPHVYKAIKRFYRNVEKIINGELYVSIGKEGYLVPDEENGETGIEFLYDNWEKIKWKKTEEQGMRNERIELVTEFKKNEIFIHRQIVIPAFYRDIKTNSSGAGETDDLNKMYAKLIRLGKSVRDKDMFDFQFNSANYAIQNTLIDIYDYFKTKLEKKNGLLRKYLMGRNVDNCTRTVITAPQYHGDRPEDLKCDFHHACIPISQVCSLCYPFVMRWIKEFFEREVFDTKNSKIIYNPLTDTIDGSMELDNPESFFNEKYLKKQIDTYIRDPESRFKKIEVPTKGKKRMFLRFTGRRYDTTSKAEIAGISDRAMTWTDLLYMACVEVTKDKHCIITRYPLTDEFGMFIAKVRVNSTTKTVPMIINGQLYKWYPVIEDGLDPEKVGTRFIDSCQFSNSYLEGMGGDYDGDQTTVKIVWTQEANQECEAHLFKKTNFINCAGRNVRKIGSEIIQTFFTMTKDPKPTSRKMSQKDRDYFVSLTPEISFHQLVEWLGKTVNLEEGKGKASEPKFYCTDTFTITAKDYKGVKGSVETTLGKFLFNKILLEAYGLNEIIGYTNDVMTDDNFGDLESALTEALREDKITVAQQVKYTDARDWLGLQLHGVITTSFTMNTLVVPKEIKKLRDDLVKEHKKELEEGDQIVAEAISKELIKKTKDLLNDDVGMDLYVSGARGSIGNNYKNINLLRGAVLNPATGKYDILTNSLMDGLDKKDMAAHSNTILNGAYPKACGTAVSGYLAKELLAACQTESLADADTDCGSKGYLTITIPAKKTEDFLDRYIIEDGGLKVLDADTLPKYIGKTVKMRSPMYCIGVGKEKHICNKCAGNFFYKIGKKDIGLMCSRPAETTKNLNMKKFHNNQIVNKVLDVNDLLI